MGAPEGLLVVDKPCGPTSHEVVARVRRALNERRIGHTGTLDPAASGVLALVIGRATRLAQFMTGDEKTYEARVQLGLETDTYDAEGTVVGQAFSGAWPPHEAVVSAVAGFRGTFSQMPPAFSAKKIGGRRSYDIARSRSVNAGPRPEAVPVTLSDVSVIRYEDGAIDLHLTCSAGFYVRALAHDIGQRLGTGAHLSGLRRTRSGGATLDSACTLTAVETRPAEALGQIVPMAQMLPRLPAVVLTEAGVRKVSHGQTLQPGDFASTDLARAGYPDEGLRCPEGLKLLSPGGALLGIATPADDGRAGVLHPCVVLM